jgi:DUF3047 family protein
MNTHLIKIIPVCLAAAAICMSVHAGEFIAKDNPDDIRVGHFSSLQTGLDKPHEWEPLVFKKIKQHTRYELVSENGMVVVKAVSVAAASGLIRKIQIDPRTHPILEWRWKVANILEKGDVTKKTGDDYAARIYVSFVYDPAKLSFFERTKYQTAKMLYGEYPPTGIVNYIWGSHARLDSIVPSPYTTRAMMISVASGSAKIGQWVTHRRNLLEDYRKAFQSEPPMISGVAIMTDTDNTGESATAFYGDIIFRPASVDSEHIYDK